MQNYYYEIYEFLIMHILYYMYRIMKMLSLYSMTLQHDFKH